MSDIGAIDPGSWQLWHLAWKIGAMSFENVGPVSAAGSAGKAVAGRVSNAPTMKAPIFRDIIGPAITGSFLTWERRRGDVIARVTATTRDTAWAVPAQRGRNLDQSVVQEPCRLGRFHARWELFPSV